MNADCSKEKYSPCVAVSGNILFVEKSCALVFNANKKANGNTKSDFNIEWDFERAKIGFGGELRFFLKLRDY
jgi:hypothetical protein